MTTPSFRDWLADQAAAQPPTQFNNGLGATFTAAALVHRLASKLTEDWSSPDDLHALLHGSLSLGGLPCEALEDVRRSWDALEPLDLDAIEARATAATAGPWWNDSHEIYASDPENVGIPAMSRWLAETCNVDLADNGAANGTFVAAARQDVPDLLAEVRRLRAKLADRRDQVLTEAAALMAHKGDALRSVVNPGQLASDLLLAARTTQES